VNDDVYRRFDQRNNLTVGRPHWDEDVQRFTNEERRTTVRLRRIASGPPGHDLRDYALYRASGIMAKSLGTQINHANRGATSWSPLIARVGDVDRVGRWNGPRETATRMVKRAARFFGADLVGIAPLDRRWIYSHAFWRDGTHKEIVFRPADAPAEREHELVIPEGMEWVIVMAAEMKQSVIRYTPAPAGCAETQFAYGRMAGMVAGVAEFIRGLGYNAIPSINDLGLNIPMAIDAGLGEQGRHGRLITPRFGPSVRLCKVITDLPLVRDHPIRFGVTPFCQVCQKCAEACPVRAICAGERSWGGESISSSPGVYTWHSDGEACRRYFVMGHADPCTTCIRVCPFTKEPGLVHDVVRFFVSRVPALDPVWVRLDDALGYGAQADPRVFWGREA
jgi:reductive dehalogenase